MGLLLHLPIEIICLITELVDLDTVFNLGSTCQQLQWILLSERIGRLALMVRSLI